MPAKRQRLYIFEARFGWTHAIERHRPGAVWCPSERRQPGATRTEMVDRILSDEVRRSFLARVPLGRFADPQEIANVVAFLVSEGTHTSPGKTSLSTAEPRSAEGVRWWQRVEAPAGTNHLHHFDT